ncbi:hypothetical protein ACFVMC_00740 [Nocardia sp. NPDC127579]|uniref:hypothetical protein n=1 Tax=Nocardia sp. NPDC127579 TaxID=3345402 RepID=UPI00362633BA
MQGPDYRELVAAVFAAEFDEGVVEVAVLRRIHAGQVTEWLEALDRSGLFGRDALATIADQWRADPAVLLDALLSTSDDVTRRRWLMAWSALDRPEPLGRIG